MDSRLEELKRVLESATEGMSSQQMLQHSEGKWCAGEVLEHLYLTYMGTIQGFEKVLTGKKPLATRASIKHRLRTLVVTGFGYMPSGRKSPEIVRPRGLPPETVKNQVSEKLVALDAILAQCEAYFGSGVPLLDHPILGPLTAAQWRTFHWVHGRHHAKQLLKLRPRAASAEPAD